MALDCIQTPKTLLSFLVIHHPPPTSLSPLPHRLPPLALFSIYLYLFIPMQVPRSNTQVRHTWVILLCLSSCICHFGESKRIRGLDVYLPFFSPLLSVSFSLTLLTTSFPNNLHTKFFNPTVVREDCQILSTRLALCVHQTCDRWLSSITADIQKKKTWKRLILNQLFSLVLVLFCHYSIIIHRDTNMCYCQQSFVALTSLFFASGGL